MSSSASRKAGRYFDRAFELPNPGLQAYYGNVRKGNSSVYTAPFAEDESTEDLLKAWLSRLRPLAKQYPSLYQYELEMMGKVGPLSYRLPLTERMPSIHEYYDDILRSSIPIDAKAQELVVREFRTCCGLQIRSEYKTVQNMKKSTNSGSPFFMKKRRNAIPLTLPIAQVGHSSDEVAQTLGPSKTPYMAAAVLGWRGQEGGPSVKDVKQRVVWMFPFAVNVKELQFYQPFIEAVQAQNLVPAWVSMESVDRQITKMFKYAAGETIICTDFSGFDQHFNRDMQECAKRLIAQILNTSHSSEDWLNNVYDIKYMIPMAYDYGKILFGRHGMGSGSGGTNADETLAHRCLQFEAAISQHQNLNPYSQCLGDDGVLSYPGITAEKVMDTYMRHGQDLNDQKQYVSRTDCIYLRRWHSVNYTKKGICVGVYPSFRALGRLRYIERWMNPEFWSAKTVALRQLAILQNVEYHPMREDLAEFCMKRDKYRLGIDIPGFLNNLPQIASEAIDYMPDFLGYTKSMQTDFSPSSINDWWIVKYLKSKA